MSPNKKKAGLPGFFVLMKKILAQEEAKARMRHRLPPS